MKNKTCKFIGHKYGNVNDSGFNVCPRCGAHEYYDYDNAYANGGYLFYPWYWTVFKYRNIKRWIYQQLHKDEFLPF